MPSAVEPSYVNRLAALLFGADRFNGRTIAAMTVYIDESGSQRVFVIGAYLARVEQWNTFTERWAAILREAGLVEIGENGKERLLPFHMTDYENRQPPFDSWDNHKRVQVISQLIDTINDTIDCALICRMPLALFEVAIPPSIRKDKKFLYMACFHSVYLKLLRLAKLNSIERLPLVFDRNREVSNFVVGVDKWMRKLIPEVKDYIGTLAFEDKEYFLPLQAADILAYESMKNADNIALANGLKRRSWGRLNRKRYGFHDHDEKSLADLVRSFVSIQGPEPWREWLKPES
jgi:hypothetical protein